MRYSQKWWVIVALLFTFASTASFLTAQTEEPSAVNAPSSAKVQTDSVGAQASSDEPEQKQPTLEPNRDTASADVENERRFNELRRELLDDRAKTLDWWLAATAIFLTFLAIIIPIIALIGGRFSFKKFNEIKDEAQRYVEEIKTRRDEADSLVKGMNAEVVGDDPDKASEVVENVQQNPDSSPIDKAVAAALSLQQQNRNEEAIEKWRSIANIVEETDSELAARAWFSVGYLASLKESNLGQEMAVNAYDKALSLNPDLVVAYHNRGMVKINLGQWDAAIADGVQRRTNSANGTRRLLTSMRQSLRSQTITKPTTDEAWQRKLLANWKRLLPTTTKRSVCIQTIPTLTSAEVMQRPNRSA